MQTSSPAPPPIRTYPGPPVLGHLRAMQHDPIGLFGQVHDAARAQAEDLLRLRVGPQTIYYVASASLADAVLSQVAIFRQTDQGHKFIGPLIGQGLVMSEAPDHRPRRQVVAPTFRHERLQDYATVMVRWATACQASWRTGSRVDIAQAMTHMTWGIVAEALFGTTLDALATEHVRHALQGVLEHIAWQISHPLAWPAGVPTPRNRRYQANLTFLRTTVDRVIQDQQPPPPTLETAARHDLITLLLAAGLSPAQLRDEAMTFLLAGHETTATALTWAFYYLAQQPDIAERVTAEVALLAGQPPTYADLARLPYTIQVFKEVLRLYPPVPLIAKQTHRPATLGPYTLPAGALVMIVPYWMHRDARYWPQPTRFDPTRHDPRPSWRPQPGFFTFGGGERLCLGNHFALLEGVLCMATIWQQVQLTLPPDAPPSVPTLAMTMHAPPALRLIVARPPATRTP